MSGLSITSVSSLEDALSKPTEGVISAMRELQGDVMLLGVAGKMGPTLARMIVRASEIAGVSRRVIGVSRFTAPGSEAALQKNGVETLSCDLLNEQDVFNLPEVPNVIYMAGMKFGATGNEAMTWAMNTYLPSVVCRKYRGSRIAAFSTGNVYGLSDADGAGSTEADTPNPTGEYAMSCLGRERMFEHFSRRYEIPMAIIRLNYACELRYGVLVDIAQKVWAGDAVDISMGWFNIIWQGDANAMTLQTFAHLESPPWMLNMTGPEKLRIRDVAEQFGRLMERPVELIGEESRTALLSDSSLAFGKFGKPEVSSNALIEAVADWVMNDGESLGKPTHFESRDGKF